jgi:cell division septum initiation protein DivIVA
LRPFSPRLAILVQFRVASRHQWLASDGQQHVLPNAVFRSGRQMTTECTPTFRRTRNGYEPIAVDELLCTLTKTHQSLLLEIQVLRTRLSESEREIAALKAEIAVLNDTSTSAHAMTYRISKLLRTAIDEVSEMQEEARTEAAAWVSAAKVDAEKLLFDAKDEATRRLDQARRASEELAQQRISILEQLMSVHRKLENLPGALESAYRQMDNPPTPLRTVAAHAAVEKKANVG